jgi:hypothetical protein
VFIHSEIRRYLYHLDTIQTQNRRKYAACQSFMLYRTLIDFLRYWRQLQTTELHKLSHSAQDELYYFFTEKLLHIFDSHLDLYWLIYDVDGKPLYEDGREPEPFWRKRLHRPECSITRMDYV